MNDEETLAQRKAAEHRWWMMQNMRPAFQWLGGHWTSEDLRGSRFENFDATRQQTAYNAARMFVEMPLGTFILYGPYGTGKTHLLAAICNALLERHIACRFATAPNLFGAIGGYVNHREDYSTLIAQAIATPLLVIDDVDKARWSEFREEIYFDILDGRAKRKLPTALSTNRLEELDTFVGGACQSRLSIGQIAIEMSGKDYRPEL